MEHLSIQRVLFSCLLGDYGVMVCLYLWACVVALLSPVIVLFRSHIAALQHITQSSISRRVSGASPWLCYTMSSCGSGAVWWETSAPLLLQNPLITWFCLCVAFFTSRQCEKKSPGTHKPCPNDNRGNTITGNTFTTNPALSPQWLALHAKPDGRMCLMYDPSYQRLGLQQSSERFIVPFFLHCPSETSSSWCVRTLSGISRAGEHQHFLIINAEVEAKSCVRQQDWYEFGSELAGRVSGLRVSGPGWPQTCAGRPGAVMKPPSVFWLSQADSCTLRARSASASSLGMRHHCKVPRSCEGSVTIIFYM